MKKGRKTLMFSAVAMLLMLSGCASSDSAQEAEELLEPAGVWNSTVKVVCQDLKVSEYLNGIVTATTYELAFEIDGVVTECDVLPGDTVEKYQMLVTLDEEERAAQLEEIDEQYERLKTQYEFENELWEQETLPMQAAWEELYAAVLAGTASREQQLEEELMALALEERESEYGKRLEEQEEALSQLEEEYTSVNWGMTKNHLCSPCDGVVVSVNVREGDAVLAGHCVIAVADYSDCYIKYEKYYSETSFNKNLYARGYIGENAFEVEYMSYTADELRAGTDFSTGMIALPARFSFDANAVDWSMGASAIVELVSDYAKNVLCVRRDAVYSDLTGDYVYKNVDGSRQRVNIVTGLENELFVEILEGDLYEGDEVYVQE